MVPRPESRRRRRCRYPAPRTPNAIEGFCYDSSMRLPWMAWFTFVFLAAGALADPASRPAGGKAFTQQIPLSDVAFDMVPIPGGEFLLGSPQREAGRNEDEGPQVRVKVEPFYMGKFEVTQAEYDVFRGRYFDLGGKAPKGAADRLADA